MFLVLIVVMLTQVTHSDIQLEQVDFMVYKVHLNKADYKTESKTFIYGACMELNVLQINDL